MKARILVGLSQLDSGNDNHWTAEGLPRLETLRMLVGDPSITRESVTLAAPSFSRGQTIELPTPVPVTKAGSSTEPAEGQAETAQGAAIEGGDSQQGLDDEETQGGADTDPGEDLGEGGNEEGAGDDPSDQERVVMLRTELDGVLAEQAHYAQRAVALQNEIALIEDEIERNKPPSENPIAKYLETQKRVLEERGRVKQAIGDSGVQLNALQKMLRSPLDAKLQQRRQLPPKR